MAGQLADGAATGHVPEKDLAVATAGSEPANTKLLPEPDRLHRWTCNWTRNVQIGSVRWLSTMRSGSSYLLLSLDTHTSRTSYPWPASRAGGVTQAVMTSNAVHIA